MVCLFNDMGCGRLTFDEINAREVCGWDALEWRHLQVVAVAALQDHALLLDFFVGGVALFPPLFGAGHDSFSSGRVGELGHGKFVALSGGFVVEAVSRMNRILLTNVIVGFGVAENAFGNDVSSRLERLNFFSRPFHFDKDWLSTGVL